MTGDITVRRLREADRAEWQALWDQYLRFYRVELAPRTTDLTFARLCAGQDGLLGLLAIDSDAHAVGLAHLLFHPSTWAQTSYCYLEDLFVEGAARGSGAAKRLIDAVYAAARERDAKRVYWHTQQFNAPARSFYDTVAHLTSFVVYEREL